MRTITLTVVFAASAAFASATPTVRTMYNDANAKEQAVRKALADPGATEVVLKAVHEAVASYESVVRHYPTSSYCDNALWQAGKLELDAFSRFHRAEDRDAAVRLLNRLQAAYPSSRLARQAPPEIARVASVRATEPPAAPRPLEDRPAAARTVLTARHGVATLRAVRRTVLPDVIRVTLELDEEVPFHDERIEGPDRVFVDLSSTKPVAPLADRSVRFDGPGDLVRQVRVGRHPNTTTRVVLDTTGVSSYSVYPLYEPYRLVIDCVRGSASRRDVPAVASAPTREWKPPVLASQPVTSELKRAPSGFARHRLAIAEARLLLEATARAEAAAASAEAAPPIPLPAAAASLPVSTTGRVPVRATAAPSTSAPAPPAPAPPASTPAAGVPAAPFGGGMTIARQLGLSVSRIVIDPGHGGHDPGAKGKGITEAELVLDVALRLEKLLATVPGVDVKLTRRTDEFVTLQDRTAMANREGADLFLSIHANASPAANARGVETYFLNFATNLSAAAVAARENATSTQAMGALPDFVKAIALNNKLDESRDFAGQVQHAMVDKLRGANHTLKDLGVKQAPFVVLIGAAMPSALAEISFVTNAQEARLLKSGAYRQKIAEALLDAIRRYQTSLKGAQAVKTGQEGQDRQERLDRRDR